MSVGAPLSKKTTRWRPAALLVGLLMVVLSLLLAIWLLWPDARRTVRVRARAALARASVVAGATPPAPNTRTDDTGSPAIPEETGTIRCPLPPGVGTVSVLIESPGPPETMWTALGQNGAFELPVHALSGEGMIKIEGFAHASFRWADAQGALGTCTLTEPWRPTDRGIVVGRVVVHGGGELPEGTTVGGCGSFRNAKVGADGEFRLEAMSAGDCDVSASFRRGHMIVEAESLRIDPSETLTEIELPMEPSQVKLFGFNGVRGDLGTPTLLVVLDLEPRGLRVNHTDLYTIALDGALSSEKAADPPTGALITSIDGISTATTADAQVELAERLLAAETTYTMR